jgi:pilus assembly protein CpaB
MTRRVLMILLVAFVTAVGASYVVYRLVRNRIAISNATPPTTQVLVAKRTLEVGMIVKKEDVGRAPWVGVVPKGIVTREEDVVERGVVSNIFEGEPISSSRLAAPGAGGGLAATIPPGMRAVAVRVDQVVGVAGFVVPGMRVDVLIMGVPPGGKTTEGANVKTVLQNVEVLSAGQNIQKDAEGKPVQVQVVSVLVTPEQAEILSLASNESRIQLVLRNPLDTEAAKTTGSNMASLFSGVRPKTQASAGDAPKKLQAVVKKIEAPKQGVAQAKPLPPALYLIEVINGPRKDQAKFNKPEEEKSSQAEEAAK